MNTNGDSKRSLAAKSVASGLTTTHIWQIQAFRDVGVLAAIAGVLWFGYAARVVTTPILLALALAYLLEPAVGLIRRKFGCSRPIAAGSMIGAFGLFVVLPLVLGVVFAGAQMVTLFTQLPDMLERAAGGIEPLLDDLGVDVQQLLERVREWVEHNAGKITNTTAASGMTLIGVLAKSLGMAVNLTLLAFLVPFFFFFISVNYPNVLDFGAALLPEKNRKRAVYLIGRMDGVVSGFVRGRLIIAAILAVFHAAGWWVCGVPGAILLGLAAGVLSIIPYAIIVAWPAAIGLLYMQESGLETGGMALWAILAWPSVVYVVGQLLEGYVLTPLIQGKATNLDMATIVAAVLAGAALAGIYGALLSIPVAACAKILLVEVVWPAYRKWVDGDAADPLPTDLGS